MIKTIHPFPARMAPELALSALASLPKGSTVLDPMSGSGTVLRQAGDAGHKGIGFDMDPLAVLMSKVWTTAVDGDVLDRVASTVIGHADRIGLDEIHLPWMDSDPETLKFVAYWFGPEQVKDLRRIAFAIHCFQPGGQAEVDALNVVRIALSRIIVTKEAGASLARDTSHSRPHRVCLVSKYDVMPNFYRALKAVKTRLIATPPLNRSQISLGDARAMPTISAGVVDAVLTSPPYLNAIDYLRGHRMSLIWIGYCIGDLRRIRSNSIGAERFPDTPSVEIHSNIRAAMGQIGDLPPRYQGMVDRYAQDVWSMLRETKRVLNEAGRGYFVVGNSCLRGTFIQNSAAVVSAGEFAGLRVVNLYERDLPNASRYLPTPAGGSLGKRMRTETIITFGHA